MNKKVIFITTILAIILSAIFVYNFIKNRIITASIVSSFQQYKKQCNKTLTSEAEKITTYKNKFYGFSFSIPDGYVVCEVGVENTEIFNLHLMPRALLTSQNQTFNKDTALKIMTDSLFIQITKGALPGLPKITIKEVLPNRVINGIESSVGIADLIGCTKKSCPRITITRFERDGFQYEFSAAKPFDEVFDSFAFLLQK